VSGGGVWYVVLVAWWGKRRDGCDEVWGIRMGFGVHAGGRGLHSVNSPSPYPVLVCPPSLALAGWEGGTAVSCVSNMCSPGWPAALLPHFLLMWPSNCLTGMLTVMSVAPIIR